MEILDKKSNRMSRANAGVFECNEFPDLQRILDFLSLRNLLSNELLFTFYEFATVPLFFFYYAFISFLQAPVSKYSFKFSNEVSIMFDAASSV